MQSSFHGVTRVNIYEYIIEREDEGRPEFKVVKIEISDRQGIHDITLFPTKIKLSVRKTSDSLVDRIIEVVPE